jgi:hypothetical protein
MKIHPQNEKAKLAELVSGAPEAQPLREIAEALRAHLERMEGNPSINTVMHGAKRFYYASAWVAGRYVGVRYISYQGNSNLTRADAECYLAWLDGGGEGRHYEALRERPTVKTP